MGEKEKVKHIQGRKWRKRGKERKKKEKKKGKLAYTNHKKTESEMKERKKEK